MYLIKFNYSSLLWMKFEVVQKAEAIRKRLQCHLVAHTRYELSIIFFHKNLFSFLQNIKFKNTALVFSIFK